MERYRHIDTEDHRGYPPASPTTTWPLPSSTDREWSRHYHPYSGSQARPSSTSYPSNHHIRSYDSSTLSSSSSALGEEDRRWQRPHLPPLGRQTSPRPQSSQWWTPDKTNPGSSTTHNRLSPPFSHSQEHHRHRHDYDQEAAEGYSEHYHSRRSSNPNTLPPLARFRPRSDEGSPHSTRAEPLHPR